MANTKRGNLDIRARRGEVVLVYQPQTYEPWVTWKVGPDGECYWGHYYRDEDRAWADFHERAKGA